MKIVFLTFGTETVASSRTRVYQYVPYLEKDGIQCFVIPANDVAISKSRFKILRFIKKRINKVIKYLKVIWLSKTCDAVLIQKVLLPISVQILIRLLNKNVIFDFDDAIWTAPLGSDYQNNKLKKLLRKSLLNHIIRISKFVIILENVWSKKYVEQYNKNILMLNSPVDCKKYFPKGKKRNKKVVIGWIGHPSNTHYLKPLFNVLKKISKNYPNVIIKLIGSSSIRIEGVDLVIKEWKLDNEVRELQDFDIGIMPLTDDEWSSGKGGYKLLQYMAVGIPCVASPVGINSTLIIDGVNGYLVSSEYEWYEKLGKLIKDKSLRELMGREGRKLVVKRYSLEASAPKLIKSIMGIIRQDKKNNT